MTASAQSLGQFTNRLRQDRVRFGELRFCSRHNHVIEAETIIHQLADRFPVDQLLRVPIEKKIDTAKMNAEMICLGEERAISKATWNRLMRMTGDKYRRLPKFRG